MTPYAKSVGENLKQALDTLRTHKMRSALTVFGVVLGVGVIMLVSALITGFNHKVEEEINEVGANTAFVSKWDQSRNGPPALEERQRKPLTMEDATAIEERCPAVMSASTGWNPMGHDAHDSHQRGRGDGHRFSRCAGGVRIGVRECDDEGRPIHHGRRRSASRKSCGGGKM